MSILGDIINRWPKWDEKEETDLRRDLPTCATQMNTDSRNRKEGKDVEFLSCGLVMVSINTYT